MNIRIYIRDKKFVIKSYNGEPYVTGDINSVMKFTRKAFTKYLKKRED